MKKSSAKLTALNSKCGICKNKKVGNLIIFYLKFELAKAQQNWINNYTNQVVFIYKKKFIIFNFNNRNSWLVTRN